MKNPAIQAGFFVILMDNALSINSIALYIISVGKDPLASFSPVNNHEYAQSPTRAGA